MRPVCVPRKLKGRHDDVKHCKSTYRHYNSTMYSIILCRVYVIWVHLHNCYRKKLPRVPKLDNLFYSTLAPPRVLTKNIIK